MSCCPASNLLILLIYNSYPVVLNCACQWQLSVIPACVQWLLLHHCHGPALAMHSSIHVSNTCVQPPCCVLIPTVCCNLLHLLPQGFLVVIPDYFKGNPRTKNDSMDTFPAW
jgi:hypothetical protein